MNLLREYIRELLAEAAYGLSEFKELDYTVSIEEDADGFEIKLYDNWRHPRAYSVVGMISAMKEASPDDGPCLGGYTVTWSSTDTPGWGPFLYDLAIEYATSKGSGLTPDRTSVSFKANKVWDYYLANRSDVEMVQMDDLSNRLTSWIKSDNCAQTLAYERGLESGTFWDEDNEETPWEPYGKDVLLKSPLSKMAKWKGASNIAALKAMDRWKEI
jgi:hypothetical protein